MPDYHPMAELAPRDVVARAMLHQMVKTHFTHVFLDARHMSETAFRGRFPGIYDMCMCFDVNPGASSRSRCIRRALHGGRIGHGSHPARSSVDNLYAVGEVAYTGLHGANRLASNSLIEALVFGKRRRASMPGSSSPMNPRI